MPLQNMCHAKVICIRREPEPEPPQTQMQAFVEYNKYQWVLYNDLITEVQNGNYGAYYQFLIEELDMAPTGPMSSSTMAKYTGKRNHKPVTPRRKLVPKRNISGINYNYHMVIIIR